MIDEDSGDPVVCPFCGEESDCPHLLACFDITFGESLGGYCFDRIDEFSGLIEGKFKLLLAGEDAKDVTWENSWLNDLYQEALTNYSPDEDYVYIFPCTLLQLIVELLFEAGATPHPGSVVDEGGPGMSSSMEILYAENPAEVFAAGLVAFEKQLG